MENTGSGKYTKSTSIDIVSKYDFLKAYNFEKSWDNENSTGVYISYCRDNITIKFQLINSGIAGYFGDEYIYIDFKGQPKPFGVNWKWPFCLNTIAAVDGVFPGALFPGQRMDGLIVYLQLHLEQILEPLFWEQKIYEVADYYFDHQQLLILESRQMVAVFREEISRICKTILPSTPYYVSLIEYEGHYFIADSYTYGTWGMCERANTYEISASLAKQIMQAAPDFHLFSVLSQKQQSAKWFRKYEGLPWVIDESYI